MSNYNIKLNLRKIEKCFVASIKGSNETKKCLCIPMDSKGVYVGEKGIYLDISAVELQSSKFGQTHFLKVSIPKEEYQKMTDEERKNQPIIGNMKPFEHAEPVNQEVESAKEVQIDSLEDPSFDDLPF